MRHQKFEDEDERKDEEVLRAFQQDAEQNEQTKPVEMFDIDMADDAPDIWALIETSFTQSDVKRAEQQHKALVEAYFRLLDVDQSDTLELDEVENGLEMMGVSAIGAANFMKAGDVNSDQKLTLEEFQALCTRASDHGMGNCIVYPYLSTCADVSSTRHLNANGFVRFHYYLDWENDRHMTIMKNLWASFGPNVDELGLFSQMTIDHPMVLPLLIEEFDKLSDDQLQPPFPQLVRAAAAGSDLLAYYVKRSESSLALSSFLMWFFDFDKEKFAAEIKQLSGIRRDCPHQELLKAQQDVVLNLRELVPILRKTPISSRKDVFQSRLKDKALSAEFISPLYPKCIERIDGKKSKVFNSFNAPILLGFEDSDTSSGGRVLYKMGQDIRADQVVVEVAQLIDDDLRKNGLDLNLNPFKIMATSVIDGWVEIVSDSTPIAKIRKSEFKGDIMAWMLDNNRDNPTAPTEEQLRKNFVRTVAGWTIVTYLLGIGDRHMDNVMLTNNGSCFHIDFDFVFGEDPKPFAPKVKISPEMQKMMGKYWENYFPDLVGSAFLIVRKHHASIMNKLVQDSQLGIEGFSGEQTKEQLSFVYDRFHLHMDDKSAYNFIKNVLHESANNKWARFFDWMHDLKQIYGDFFAWLIVLFIFAVIVGLVGGIVFLLWSFGHFRR